MIVTPSAVASTLDKNRLAGSRIASRAFPIIRPCGCLTQTAKACPFPQLPIMKGGPLPNGKRDPKSIVKRA
jgi:hypothetical protein